MVLSDRIALLRLGELEQISSPREIYSRPATVYTAQFIGHTNLLRAEVKGGVAQCEGLRWPTASPDGMRLFSLRPESIRQATSGVHTSDASTVRFRATVQQRSFHGATELLQVQCGRGLTLSVRTASREDWQGEQEFEFSAADAIPVRESHARGDQ